MCLIINMMCYLRFCVCETTSSKYLKLSSPHFIVLLITSNKFFLFQVFIRGLKYSTHYFLLFVFCGLTSGKYYLCHE